MATLTDTQRGAFSAITSKRGTANIYDASNPYFVPSPDGPFEEPTVSDQTTAQQYYNATREIKLREPRGSDLPMTSYRDHYPPKDNFAPGEPLELPLSGLGVPFTATSEYTNEFFEKPRGRGAAAPDLPPAAPHVPGMMIIRESTKQAHYKPYEIDPGPGTMGTATRRSAAPPAMPSIYDTTYRNHYVPKDLPAKIPTGTGELPPALPWLNDGTTYNAEFVLKPLKLLPPADAVPGQPYPFSGRTEYNAEFVPKESDPFLPPLIGIVSAKGLQLPLPRRSLGVEFVHRGRTDQYFMLLPRTMPVPCVASQVFTTVNDDQETACILVLYGDSPIASENMLLGQFDVVHIPKAPRDVPRIEVVFHLDANMYLTVEARDLDTHRHKQWLQRGQIVVLRE